MPCWRRAMRLAGVALSLSIVPLPSPIKIPLYRWLFGYQIGRGVRIGLSWIHVDRLVIGDGVRIGHLNRLNGLPQVELGDCTIIGHRNTFVSSVEFTSPEAVRACGNHPKLVMGAHSSMTMQHHFDVNDLCDIGAFTVVAGVQSVFFTHYLDLTTSTQAVRPLRIGPYCMLGAAVRMSPGAAIGEGTVVGMGAVVTRVFTDRHVLLAGSPATIVKALSPDALFFNRPRGWIGTYATAPLVHHAAP